MATLTVKWSGKDYVIADISKLSSVKDLKDELNVLTGVLPEHQKLLGLKYKGNSLIIAQISYLVLNRA